MQPGLRATHTEDGRQCLDLNAKRAALIPEDMPSMLPASAHTGSAVTAAFCSCPRRRCSSRGSAQMPSAEYLPTAGRGRAHFSGRDHNHMTSEQQIHTCCARLATSEHLRAQIVKNEYLFSLSACGKAVPWFSRGSKAVGQAATMLAGGPKATADTRG